MEIEKEGYRPIKVVVPLKETRTVLSYPLESLGRTVQVSSYPPGANVFLDGRDTGKVTDCEIPLVPHGPHTLKMKKEYYADWEEEFTVPEGNDPFSKSALLTVKDYAPARSWGGQDKKFYVVPKALALDKSGNFYVADTGNNRVQKFAPDGRFICQWGGSGVAVNPLTAPIAVAVNEKGSVFVLEGNTGRIQEFKKPSK